MSLTIYKNETKKKKKTKLKVKHAFNKGDCPMEHYSIYIPPHIWNKPFGIFQLFYCRKMRNNGFRLDSLKSR